MTVTATQKKRTTTYLSPYLDALLVARATELGISQNAVICIALASYLGGCLKTTENPVPPQSTTTPDLME